MFGASGAARRLHHAGSTRGGRRASHADRPRRIRGRPSAFEGARSVNRDRRQRRRSFRGQLRERGGPLAGGQSPFFFLLNVVDLGQERGRQAASGMVLSDAAACEREPVEVHGEMQLVFPAAERPQIAIQRASRAGAVDDLRGGLPVGATPARGCASGGIGRHSPGIALNRLKARDAGTRRRRPLLCQRHALSHNVALPDTECTIFRALDLGERTLEHPDQLRSWLEAVLLEICLLQNHLAALL
mmetsp:Transcript_137950/g.440560  ORF Transcript_137950/g.440560 Transcript_137950/m.440560 type:complete len:244 (-) Transcript_137950:1841-2572(-)